MASFEDIIAALKGGQPQPNADAMAAAAAGQLASQPQRFPTSYGTPEADAAAMQPETYANPVVGHLAKSVMDVPKHLIDQAAQFDPTDIHGSNERLVPAATDTALAVMGGSGALPATTNELRMGIKAFHASPHDFNAFSLANKGSGEGKADFGHGIYAAENPAVNKYYHDQFGPNAKTYHLDINAEPHQLLDLDKPISKAHLESVLQGGQTFDYLLNHIKQNGITGELTGKHVYEALANGMGPANASEYLKSVGIPGAKYLDAGSKMKGSGTSNYVMYDPNLIDILKKEGAAPAIPSTPLSSGDAFRQEALKARNEFYHNDVMKAQGDFKQKLQKPMTPEDLRIAQGYTTPAYRGVNLGWNGGMTKDVNPIYNKHSGHAVNSNMYSTASPELADMYSGKIDPKWWKPGMGAGYSEGAAVQPLYLDTSKYHTIDAGGKKWGGAPYDEMKRVQAEGKIPGAIIHNVYDTPLLDKSHPPTTVYATFPQGAPTAKSKFASKFDPTDPNLLHGVAGAVPTAGMVDALRDKKEKK